MKRFLVWTFAAVVSLVGFAACDGGGGGGGGSPVGTWTIDVDRTLQVIVDQKNKEGKEKIAALPADQRAAAEKRLADQVAQDRAGAVPLVESMQMTFDLKADKTATMSATMFGKSNEGTATWSQSGSTLTITPKTDNGKPVAGAKAKPQDFKFEGGALVLQMGRSPPVYLKRK